MTEQRITTYFSLSGSYDPICSPFWNFILSEVYPVLKLWLKLPLSIIREGKWHRMSSIQFKLKYVNCNIRLNIVCFQDAQQRYDYKNNFANFKTKASNSRRVFASLRSCTIWVRDYCCNCDCYVGKTKSNPTS